MNITLYKNFSKKKNSTKRPVGGQIFDAKFKAPTSYENPTFIIHGIDFEYNYAKWGNHYYFIDDIVIGNNDIFEVHCSQDVLATFRTNILNYEAYVERSDSMVNPLLPDSAVSRQNRMTAIANSYISFFDEGIISSEGCYKVQIISKQSEDSNNGIATYFMSVSSLKNLLSFMFDDSGSIWEGITDATVKSIFNPFQYITSIQWVPTALDTFISQFSAGEYKDVGVIQLGWWSYVAPVGVHFYQLSKSTTFHRYIFHMNIPGSTYSKDEWQRYDSRFTQYQITLPGYGAVKLDPMLIASNVENDGSEKIHVYYDLDLLTGSCNISIRTWEQAYKIFESSMQWFIPVQIAQLADNGVLSIGKGIVEGVAGLATANPVAISSGLSDAVSGIMSAASPQPTLNGTQGNRAAILGNTLMSFEQTCYHSMINYQKVFGRPLGRYIKLSELSGFCKCQNASVDVDSLGTDKNEINNYLNNGFYIE